MKKIVHSPTLLMHVMDPTKSGQEPDISFGSNIPALVEVIFDLTSSEGGPTGRQLPVDLSVIEDGVLVTEEVAYPVGYQSED